MNFKKFNGSTWETVQHKIYGSGTDSLTAFPAMIQASGEPLTDYTIYGNTLQDGTPTPEAPVDVVGCGVRTDNLFDAATAYGNMYNSATGVLAGNASALTFIKNKFDSSMIGVPITISIHADEVPVTRTYIRCTIGGENIDSNSIANGKTGTMMVTITPTSANDDWRITFGTGAGDLTLSNIMLNLGSTALPYEPYGYKIPVTSGGVTTNLYLDEPLGAGDTLTYTDTGIALPTFDGDNTIAFGTTVQPSAMSATFKGWHPVQGAKQYDGNDWR
jgi:hypothetical protein